MSTKSKKYCQTILSKEKHMNYLALFFAGAFLCNSIPHLTSGLQGRPFPTPFAKPHGVGMSPPVVNFLWGALNLLAGAALLSRHPVEVGFNSGFVALTLGILAVGIFSAIHFSRHQ
jgi:hypothetical protein